MPLGRMPIGRNLLTKCESGLERLEYSMMCRGPFKGAQGHDSLQTAQRKGPHGLEAWRSGLTHNPQVRRAVQRSTTSRWARPLWAGSPKCTFGGGLGLGGCGLGGWGLGGWGLGAPGPDGPVVPQRSLWPARPDNGSCGCGLPREATGPLRHASNNRVLKPAPGGPRMVRHREV